MKKLSIGGLLLLLAIAIVFSLPISDQTVDDHVEVAASQQLQYTFRTEELYESHFQKHRAEFDTISKESYLQKANELIANPSALTKYEEDGDLLYYEESENEFLVLSSDGYIRTFFKPDDGMAYYNRQ